MGAVTPGARGAPVMVVLADDHPIWRDGVRADLGEGFSVVAEAGTADEAIAAVREHRPDLVVCDLHMPGGGGIKVARVCGEDTRIVMLTVSEAERDLLDAVAAGAVGGNGPMAPRACVSSPLAQNPTGSPSGTSRRGPVRSRRRRSPGSA